MSVLVAAGYEEVPLVEQLPVVRWLGATGVQVYPNYGAPLNASTVRRQIEDAGLALRSMHGPFGPGYDVSSPDADERTAAVDRLIASLDTLVELTGEFVVLHPAAVVDGTRRRTRQRRRRLAAESLALLVPEAVNRGVRLAVENMPRGWLGGKIKELIEIVETVGSPSVRVCFDIGHANCVGRPIRMWRQAEPYVITMHLHDNDGSADQHREPFAGKVNWRALRRELERARYTGDVVLECGEALLALYRRGETAWRDRFRAWWTGEGETA